MLKIESMFSIFRKKYFIADYLEGLTEMHCHVLPGIDDGAQNDQIALEMLKKFVELGYKEVIATPHIMDGMYQNSSRSITKTLEDFKKVKNVNGFKDLPLRAASEYMLDLGFDGLMEKKDFLPIKENIVLVEMSYFQKTTKAEYQIFDFQQLGFKPILAHPERYGYLQGPEEILDYKLKGCFLQLNLLSLSDHYGPQVTKKAFHLLENDHYNYLGSDAHHPAHLDKIKELRLPQKMIPKFEALVERTKENLKQF